MIDSYCTSEDPSKINIIKRKIVHLVGDGSKFCKIKVRKKNFLQLAKTSHESLIVQQLIFAAMRKQAFRNKYTPRDVLLHCQEKNGHQRRLASILVNAYSQVLSGSITALGCSQTEQRVVRKT